MTDHDDDADCGSRLNEDDPLQNHHSETQKDERDGLSFWQMTGSTLAAAFGVQTQNNRERDFAKGKATHFIAMGIGFTFLFVLIMIGLVSLVLSNV